MGILVRHRTRSGEENTTTIRKDSRFRYKAKTMQRSLLRLIGFCVRLYYRTNRFAHY
jgi:hypothetical protein